MTIEELFALYNPSVRATAEKARALVLDVFPDALEQVDAPDKMIHYGLGTKMAQQVFYIAGYTAHANLGLWFGSSTRDPHNLLEGTGKRLRHVKLRSPQDVDRPGLRELLQDSLADRRASM
ncbi:MAG TPA: DUF1801 domain-containing protein [Chloroflexia bacterium]|nr:DUF1801 domain-containing protein [Chloroflexia bacterium]